MKKFFLISQLSLAIIQIVLAILHFSNIFNASLISFILLIIMTIIAMINCGYEWKVNKNSKMYDTNLH